jgi:Cft2 family RNA processing exonuclease
LIPAGHLPGASLILLTYQLPNRTYKVLYTGDFSLSNLQLVEGLSLENLRGLAPDVLILESSYGTRRHPHRRQQEKRLMEQINEALQRGRNVLLPVPPLGLGQEILKLLRSHHQFTGQDLDIWVGGSLQQACDRYLELLPQFPLAVQNFAKHQPLFWDERVCPRLRPLTFKQEQTATDKPYIVLTDQWETFLQSEDWQRGVWTVLLPEFPTEESLPDFNSLAAQPSPRVAIETYLLAEHSDGRNTTQFIHNVRPRRQRRLSHRRHTRVNGNQHITALTGRGVHATPTFNRALQVIQALVQTCLGNRGREIADQRGTRAALGNSTL